MKKCGIVTMVSTILVGLAFGLAGCDALPECSCGCYRDCCVSCQDTELTVCVCHCNESKCDNKKNGGISSSTNTNTDSDSEEEVEE